MKKKLYLVSCGTGCEDGITIRAKKIIDSVDIVLGSPRLISVFAKGRGFIELPAKSKDAIDLIKSLTDETVAVLVSGDAGFYSLALHLKVIDREIEVIPGVSVVQASSAKLKTAWHDAKLLSLHSKLTEIPKNIGKSIILTKAGLDMIDIMDDSWLEIYDIFIMTEIDGAGEEIKKWDGERYILPPLTVLFLQPKGGYG